MARLSARYPNEAREQSVKSVTGTYKPERALIETRQESKLDKSNIVMLMKFGRWGNMPRRTFIIPSKKKPTVKKAIARCIKLFISQVSKTD